MIKKIASIIILLSFSFISSQNLKLETLEQLTKISFVSIDEYMTNVKGFSKIKEERDGKVKFYGKKENDDINNIIYIKVISNINSPLNALDITTGKNINITKLKNELIDNGYEYGGENYGMIIYKKNGNAFLIKEKFNDMEANQILFIFEK